MNKLLYCELAASLPGLSIFTQTPQLSWRLSDFNKIKIQGAYRVIVASSLRGLDLNEGDLWDSGKVISADTLHIEYEGSTFCDNEQLFWSVCLWDKESGCEEWSGIGYFTYRNCIEMQNFTCGRNRLVLSRVKPELVRKNVHGRYFIQFAKAGFAALEITIESKYEQGHVDIHFGEKLTDGGEVDKNPLGCIRYRKVNLELKKGLHKYLVEVPLIDGSPNMQSASIKLPEDFPQVTPYRYCEIGCANKHIEIKSATMLMLHYPFDNNSSEFSSSDNLLNSIWDLCKNTIKGTSFCGIYVDGDRERIPYESDVYINQLSHYATDSEYSLARFSHEYMLTHPTWPTEWIMHSLLIAWADFMYTGDSSSLNKNYSCLKFRTLVELERSDGLISTVDGKVTDELLKRLRLNEPMRDIVDWPPAEFTKGSYGERDGYVMTEYNTVVNAFHYQALMLIGDIAEVIGETSDAASYKAKAKQLYVTFNEVFFDHERKIYHDGIGTDHASLHANIFALVFDLVPEKNVGSVVKYILSKGMACSVYGAQYLLEALYKNGKHNEALALITARNDRSWWNMLQTETTMTWEAWDWKYKINLDWNHAWGTAPANIIMRYLMGIRPLEPGFSKVLIQPCPGGLTFFNGICPTIRGGIILSYNTTPELTLNFSIPKGMSAEVDLSFVISNKIKNIELNSRRLDNVNNPIHIDSGDWHICINELAVCSNEFVVESV